MGRELTFSNPKIIDLIKKNYIAVAADDWYQRRKDDEEGKFFRAVADQGPRKGKGGSTRQGIYIFTASGKLLDYRNHQDPNVMHEVIKKGLQAWAKLPANQREPGAVNVPSLGKVDKQYNRTPPKGTLIVKVFTRILEKDDDNDFKHGTCSFPGGDKAARDNLWLLESEWKSLIPKDSAKGQSFDLPKNLTLRIMRFHLIDNTRGEPPMWEKNQVQSAKITLTVQEANEKGVLLRLDGKGLLANNADAHKANRGFDVSLLGYIHYDAQKKTIDRFDVVALGDHWGAGPFTPNPRPGKAPLGVAFTLAEPDAPASMVPPQGSRFLPGYLYPEKQ